MKFLLSSLALLTASAALAAPGSYAPLALGLTFTESTGETSRVLKNGNTEFTLTRQVYAVTSSAILAEATSAGLLNTANYKGWAVVASYDRDAVLRGFFAYNKTLGQAVDLTPILYISRDMFGRSEAGKFQRTPADAIASGSISFREAGVVNVRLGGAWFAGITATAGKETLKKASDGGMQWVTAAAPGQFNAFSDEGATLTGKFNLQAGKQVVSAETTFPLSVD